MSYLYNYIKSSHVANIADDDAFVKSFSRNSGCHVRWMCWEMVHSDQQGWNVCHGDHLDDLWGNRL